MNSLPEEVRNASMQPRPDDRGELAIIQSGRCFARGASMQPRPDDRGERPVLDGALHEAEAAASMQPRPDDRGEPNDRDAGPLLDGLLQCSHGLMTVENTP